MGVADGSARRTVTVERIAQGVFTAANTRGGQLSSGTGSVTDFTPTELLLAAIAGCTTIGIDILTSRRAEPDSFQVRADADKVRDAHGNRLTGIVVASSSPFLPAGTVTGPGPSCRMWYPLTRTSPGHGGRPAIFGWISGDHGADSDS
jgi:hypothetical protein